MAVGQNIGEDGFVWFLGIVADINDPKKLGRIKVRVFNLDGPPETGIDNEDLQWAIPLMPVTSASFYQVGRSPTGIVPGSRVIGFYIDGMIRRKPVVMGTYPIIDEGKISGHSVSKQARGEGEVEKTYLDYEPRSQYAAEYPYNKTINTSSGHVIEIDDTPEAERIHIYHRSGTYIEMNPDGSVVARTADKNIDISIGDKFVASEEGNIIISTNSGNVEITSKGDCNVLSEGNVTVSAPQGVLALEAALISING